MTLNRRVARPRSPQRARGWARLRPRRRSAREKVGWFIVGSFFTVAGVLLIGYVKTDVPKPSSISTAQVSRLTYADGKTELGRLGQVDRTSVPLSKVPTYVQHAVLSAEDRRYYDEPGISVHGIARALWANVRGGGISQGGSTITQQYAKNAFLTQERTLSRKVREMFIAVKLDRQHSKQQILADYLNTIYFGRGAYGIEAASQAYFGTSVERITPAQGALIAAVLRAPSLYEPIKHRDAAEARWHYVVDGMVAQHWLAASDASSMRFPTVRKPTLQDTLDGPDGHIVQAVRVELAKHGYDDDKLAAGGYTVVTTIDRKAQAAAVAAVDSVLGDRAAPVAALAAVQPGTGRVLAMYGGRDFTGRQPAAQLNLATRPEQPGSSFKPYTLATALEQGISLRTDYRGTSPLRVDGWQSKGNIVRNSGGEQCYRCDLVRATADSVNTIFAQLVMDVGPDNVAKTARAAGITSTLTDGGVVPPSITLGSKEVSPLEQADGYATFAAGGVHVPPYLVASVLRPDKHADYKAAPPRTRAFDPEVAADATYAMTKVVQYGTGTRAALDGRPVAGKTGTTSNNTDAWFVGFTPQLSAAVWLGNLDNSPLTNVPGYRNGIFGGQLPAEIWHDFMQAALSGAEVKAFPDPAFVGISRGGLPRSAPTNSAPSTSASLSASPSAAPSTPTPSSPAPSGPAPSSPLPSSPAPSSPAPSSPGPASPRPSSTPPAVAGSGSASGAG